MSERMGHEMDEDEWEEETDSDLDPKINEIEDIAEAIDWRDLGGVTPVKD